MPLSEVRIGAAHGRPAGGARPQSGAALLALVTVLIVFGSAVLLEELKARAGARMRSELETVRVLNEASAALVGLAATNPDVPGALPFPDRNNDGKYDGDSDCPPVWVLVVNTHLLGHLPWQGQGGPCLGEPAAMGDLRDGSDAPLLYAVSENLVRRSDGTEFLDPPINPSWGNLAPGPWITVRDRRGSVLSERVAFVVIAPGAPLEDQDRSDGAASVENYLDTVSVGGVTYSNADFDQDFIVYPDSRRTANPDDRFNDRLAYVTVDELLHTVERRVLGTIAAALRAYRADHGAYPWLGAFDDPRYRGTPGVREGRLPFHSAAPMTYRSFATRLDAAWRLENAEIRAAGTVDFADLRSGTLRVSAAHGTCSWSAADAIECTATRIESLSPPIERTFRFMFADGAVSVTDPTGADVRRRSVNLTHPFAKAAVEVLQIVDTDTNTGTGVGAGKLTIHADTTGSIGVGGLRHDLAIPEELPAWFVQSGWHEFLYIVISGGHVPGGPAGCGGLNPPCVTLRNWYPPQDDKRAVILSAGSELSGQERAVEATLDAYYERENSTSGDDIFERGIASTTFNDQVRIVAP